jgi:hypothetical protein
MSEKEQNNRDSFRSKIDETKEMEMRREERSTRKMGDLHLREEGLSKKASSRFRRRIKHYSDKIRRREDKRLSKNFEDYS